MSIFDIIIIICCILLIIDFVLLCIFEKLYPKEHPKFSTVTHIMSVITSSITSILFSTIIIETFLN